MFSIYKGNNEKMDDLRKSSSELLLLKNGYLYQQFIEERHQLLKPGVYKILMIGKNPANTTFRPYNSNTCLCNSLQVSANQGVWQRKSWVKDGNLL